MWLTTDSFEKAFSVAALESSMVGIVAFACALGLTINHYFDLSKKAFGALGKHKITVVFRDRNARMCYKGIMAMMKGRLAKAEELLMEALNNSDVLQNQLFCIEWLGKIYEMTGDQANVLWTYRRSAELAPDRADLQCRLGNAYYADGKLDKAMYCFEQAIKYDPNNGYPYYNIAKIYMIRSEYDKAHEEFEQLLKINDSHPLVFAEMATLYAIENDVEKAKEYCTKAIMCGIKDPESLSASITAILNLGRAKDYDESDIPHEYNSVSPKAEEETREGDGDAGNE